MPTEAPGWIPIIAVILTAVGHAIYLSFMVGRKSQEVLADIRVLRIETKGDVDLLKTTARTSTEDRSRIWENIHRHSRIIQQHEVEIRLLQAAAKLHPPPSVEKDSDDELK